MKYLPGLALLLVVGTTGGTTGRSTGGTTGSGRAIMQSTAEAQLMHGDYKNAVSSFESGLAKDPGDIRARVGLVQALLETGEYGAAEARLREFLKTSEDAALRNQLGEALFETGRYQQSAVEFEKGGAIAKGADWLQAKLGQARALIAQGKQDGAQPLLRQLPGYQNNGNDGTAVEFTLIAQGLVYLERYKEANDFYIDARQKDPGYL
ncbi:MAG TPA: tetratricopeptide repeat protein, partial [Blastocatellia bacterium]|nr:tetratricopeptide repeat protein [Blastocatellia bacterium]